MVSSPASLSQVVSNYQTLFESDENIFSHPDFETSTKVFSQELSSFPFTGLTDQLIVLKK